jgi:uncharacterized membrane protein
VNKFLLSLHVLAAIIAIGPVAVAASMFPRALRRAHEVSDAASLASMQVLYRVCRVYAGVGIAVPVFGFATASNMRVLGSAWLITAIALTAVAAGVLALWILPAQQAALGGLDSLGGLDERDEPGESDVAASDVTTSAVGKAAIGKVAARLGAAAGIFNLLWATVTVLMIVRPGSTTGA